MDEKQIKLEEIFSQNFKDDKYFGINLQTINKIIYSQTEEKIKLLYENFPAQLNNIIIQDTVDNDKFIQICNELCE